MFLFQRKYRPLLGLDITTSSVKLIELTMGGGQYRVEAYAAEPTPQNAIHDRLLVDAEAVGGASRRRQRRGGAGASRRRAETRRYDDVRAGAQRRSGVGSRSGEQ